MINVELYTLGLPTFLHNIYETALLCFKCKKHNTEIMQNVAPGKKPILIINTLSSQQKCRGTHVIQDYSKEFL